MRFKYSGVTKARDNVTGFVEAEDENEARLKLRSMQVRPVNLIPAKAGSGGGSGTGGGLFGGGGANEKGGPPKEKGSRLDPKFW